MANDLMSSTTLNCFTSRGNYAKWDDQDKWRDRDGVPLDEQYLVADHAFGLQAWIDGQPKLVPDNGNIDELNTAIPKEQWPKAYGRNGTEPPYKKVAVVLLINLRIGAVYRFVSPTKGARIAVEALQEQMEVMKLLRGASALPIVTLGERHMKTKEYGPILRPHFEVIAWKYVGGESGEAQALPPPDTPRLVGPTAEAIAPSAPTSPTPALAAPASPVAPTVPLEPQPHPIPAPETKPPSAKKPIPLSAYKQATMTGTAPTMKDVAPVTTEEILDDTLEDLSWDTSPSNPKSSPE
jgi:hypothetical protein